MSMYAQILDAALCKRPIAHSRTTTPEALSEFLYCRDRLSPSETQAEWTTIALANQVAYDIALIELARSVGLNVDPNTFDQPERRRTELRRELIARGIRLDKLDQLVQSTSEGG